jgi:pSer/pThr/pTyr-binding forkhead associated (FHA) protein
MAERLFITIGSRARKDRVLLEMPGDQPIREWIHDLALMVGWNQAVEDPPDAFFLETEAGERLPAEETLLDAGITSSDLLYLTACEKTAPADTEVDAAGARQPQTGPADAPAGISLQEINQRPRLTGPRGLVILLGEPPLTVGRAGKNFTPDIDLTEWDAGVIASRKHAVLEKAGDRFSLHPEKTTNGTFLNGVEVPAGDSRILSVGDRIQFGFGGVELVFRVPV